jgi:hypothetical protein
MRVQLAGVFLTSQGLNPVLLYVQIISDWLEKFQQAGLRPYQLDGLISFILTLISSLHNALTPNGMCLKCLTVLHAFVYIFTSMISDGLILRKSFDSCFTAERAAAKRNKTNRDDSIAMYNVRFTTAAYYV